MPSDWSQVRRAIAHVSFAALFMQSCAGHEAEDAPIAANGALSRPGLASLEIAPADGAAQQFLSAIDDAYNNDVAARAAFLRASNTAANADDAASLFRPELSATAET